MRLWTSYYSAIARREDIANAVNLVKVSNTAPKWFPYNCWVLDTNVYPSWSIINRLKDGSISYDEFKRLYLKELDGRTKSADVLTELKQITVETGIDDVVLLCWEVERCHRFILAEWLGTEYKGEIV